MTGKPEIPPLSHNTYVQHITFGQNPNIYRLPYSKNTKPPSGLAWCHQLREMRTLAGTGLSSSNPF